MQPKPSTCSGCPLESLGLGFVHAEGPLDSPYILVGEGPGENEAIYGVPFFRNAPSGARLSDWLARAGIPRASTYITNAIRCLTVRRGKDGKPILGTGGRPQKRDPSPSEVKECARRHLFPELAQVLASGPPGARRVIIPIGGPAQLVLTGLSGNNYSGSLQAWNPPTLPSPLPREQVQSPVPSPLPNPLVMDRAPASSPTLPKSCESLEPESRS